MAGRDNNLQILIKLFSQDSDINVHTMLSLFADIPEELYPPLGVHVTVLTHTTLNVSWHDTDRYQKERYYVVSSTTCA